MKTDREAVALTLFLLTLAAIVTVVGLLALSRMRPSSPERQCVPELPKPHAG
jgi:hypothetical protein